MPRSYFDSESLVFRLRKYLEENKMLQKDAAAAIGVCPRRMSKWLSAGYPVRYPDNKKLHEFLKGEGM